jgi:predicted kinase
VVELVPPAVQTSLATPPHGAPLDAFCEAVFDELVNSAATVIGHGPTVGIDDRSQEELRQLFVQSAARAGVTRYG